MMITKINWPLVRYRMAEQKVRSMTALARGAHIHRNTLEHDGPFTSTTLDRLGHFLRCDPRELLTVEDVPGIKPVSPTTKPPLGPRATMPNMDTSNVPPEKAQAEAERKAALLAQAKERTK